MRHCHFSILYNELPFLKQKLPFLYKHFDQIIFYDLNVCTDNPHPSTDGSHEYILNYPDPENKIILIEKNDLSDVKEYAGAGSIAKQKMFSVGSSYVRSDIDIFWCTDMDEFFHESFIKKVENIFLNNPDTNSVDLRHKVFWKNFSYILADHESDVMTLYSRVCRHRPGNLYSHCAIQKQFPKTLFLEEADEVYYHFGWVGNKRVLNKIKHYTEPPTGTPSNKKMYDTYLENVWNKFNATDENICDGKVFGYPNMHPNYLGVKKGIRKIEQDSLPTYVDYGMLLKDLEEE